MEDKIEKLLFSPNINNVELALILAKNEGMPIEQLPTVQWILRHVFKLEALPTNFEIDAKVITAFTTKKTIGLAGKLGCIPENVYLLKHLIKLSLDFENQEGHLSNALSKLENLTILQIKNYTSTLPSNLWALKKLKSLEITHCPDLSEKSSIWEMNWLERLELENCNLHKIPPSIQQFEHLDYFSIQENPIKKLPNELLNLPKLKFISCYQCQNLTIPSYQMESFNKAGIILLK